MKESIMELLMKIPKEATSATVQGIEMQMIDNETRLEMLRSNSEHVYSEAIYSNGLFMAIIKDGRLLTLYKVIGSPTEEMFRSFGKESV